MSKSLALCLFFLFGGHFNVSATESIFLRHQQQKGRRLQVNLTNTTSSNYTDSTNSTNATNATCTIPKFIGEWEWYTPCPLTVAESQGGIIGNDIVLYSGNAGNWSQVTRRTYAYNVVTNNGTWRLMDPVPINRGITHAGFAIVGNLLYSCGGYMFGRPSALCFLYNHSAPRTKQWKSFVPSLPAIRAAGGMVYNSNRHSLIFISGVNRYFPQDNTLKVDQNDVWELSLSNTSAGWKARAKSPYAANHLGVTTVRGYNGDSLDRHYMVGGQVASNESNGNFDLLYEYNATANVWTKRANMLFPRGHLLNSVTPYKNCGFIISGGAGNNGTHINDVSYYSIDTDTWTSIGNLVSPINTPVCGIKNEYYICQAGGIDWMFSWRRKIA